MATDQTVIAPAWLLTVVSTRKAGISLNDGRWSVVVDGPAATSRSLDDALVGASPNVGPLGRS